MRSFLEGVGVADDPVAPAGGGAGRRRQRQAPGSRPWRRRRRQHLGAAPGPRSWRRRVLWRPGRQPQQRHQLGQRLGLGRRPGLGHRGRARVDRRRARGRGGYAVIFRRAWGSARPRTSAGTRGPRPDRRQARPHRRPGRHDAGPRSRRRRAGGSISSGTNSVSGLRARAAIGERGDAGAMRSFLEGVGDRLDPVPQRAGAAGAAARSRGPTEVGCSTLAAACRSVCEWEWRAFLTMRPKLEVATSSAAMAKLGEKPTPVTSNRISRHESD